MSDEPGSEDGGAAPVGPASPAPDDKDKTLIAPPKAPKAKKAPKSKAAKGGKGGKGKGKGAKAGDARFASQGPRPDSTREGLGRTRRLRDRRLSVLPGRGPV